MKLCIDCKIKYAAKHRKICLTCKSRRWRLKYPYEYAYNNLKYHAKSRNIKFLLTFDEFKEFAIKYDYVNKKGNTKFALHIDRIKEGGPYHKDNIQPLQNYLNVKKYIEFRYINTNGDKIFKTTKIINNLNPSDDCPF